MLAFAATAVTLALGQLSFLLLLPVTLAWASARRGHWGWAGLWLGLALSIKPFLLIVLPYLLLKRQFKALGATLLAVTLCFLAGTVVFGVDTQVAWLRVLGAPSWEWDFRNGSIMGLLARALDQNPYYTPLVFAPGLIRPLWLIAAGVVGVVTLGASLIGSGSRAVDRAFGLLLLGAQLMSPLGWVYYMWLPVGPLSALALSWWRERDQPESSGGVGVSPWRWVMLAIAVLCLVWPFVATTVLQPSPLATVTVGAVYFWGTLILWVTSLADSIPLVARRPATS